MRCNSVLYTLTILFLICLPAELPGQSGNDDILDESQIFTKFGKIPAEVFEYESDHSAPFEYILKEVSIEFDEGDRGIVAYIHYLVRLKIFTDQPVQQAEAGLIGIPYYSDNNMELVTNLAAITWKPDGQFYSVGEQQVRNAELNSRYRLIEFEMPEVNEGDILEYKYTIERRYIEELPDIFFSDRVPVREMNVYLKNADYLRYNILEENIEFELKHEEFQVDTSSVPAVFTYERPNPVQIEKWSAENIPAVDATDFISSLDDVRAKLKFQVSEFGIPRQPLENSWEFVAAQIRRNSNPFDVIENHTEMMSELSDRFSGISSKQALQDSIFQYVNSSVQFSGTYDLYAENGLSRTLEGSDASQSEVNTLLLGLLRQNGIDAYPVFVSARESGRINQAFPSLYQFNRFLVISEIEGEETVMDASYSNSLPGLIPLDVYNRQGFVLRDHEFEWISITPEESRFKLELEIEAALDEKGTLAGEMWINASGYPAREIRRSLAAGESEKEVIDGLFFDRYADAELKNSEIQGNGSNREKIQLRAAFEIPNYAVSFSDGLEYPPMLAGYLYQNPFEEASRRTPITLDAPEQLNVNYVIELPAGNRSGIRQGEQKTDLPGAELSEVYNIDGKTLNYSFGVQIDRNQFSTEEYARLRMIYERWVNLSNEKWFIENEK